LFGKLAKYIAEYRKCHTVQGPFAENRNCNMMIPNINFIKKAIFPLFFFILLSAGTKAQHTIEGTVLDDETEGPLVSATVQLLELNRVMVTNRSGRFVFNNVPEGSYTIQISFIGHKTVSREIRVPDETDQLLEFILEEQLMESEELIVTASPLGSAVQYQPAQSLNIEEIQRKNVSSIGEMLNNEPGISMRYLGPATSRPVIRGFDGERILILQNGERMGDLSGTSADHGIAMEPLSAEKVEVVRGPASLLYGTNALGGVVNIFSEEIPRNWSQGLSGNLSLQGLSLNASGAGLTNVTYGLDDWAFTGRFSFRDGGSVRTPLQRIPGTFNENLTAGVGTGFRKNNIRGGASFNFQDQTFGIPEALDDPDEQIEVQVDRKHIQSYLEWFPDGFIENIEWRFAGTRFSQQEVEFEFENGELAEREIGLDFLQYTVSSTLTLKHKSFGIFNDGAFGFNTNLRFLDVGGEEAFTPDGNSQFVALFAFEEVPLTETFKLQAGSRVEYQNISEDPNELFPDANLSRDKVIFSGSFGINYRPVRFLELGAQFARSQRLPSFEELFADGPHVALGTFDIGDPNLDNEKSNGVDAFARIQTQRFHLEISGFYNKINEFIFRRLTGDIDPESGFPVVELTAGDAELYGGEAFARYSATNRLSLEGSLDYVRGSRTDTETNPLPLMPPLSGQLGATNSTHDWWFGAELQLVDEQDRVAPNEDPTDGYELVGLEAGYRFDMQGKHILSLKVDNLFNVTYREHLSRIEDRNFPMPARSIGVTYRWIF